MKALSVIVIGYNTAALPEGGLQSIYANSDGIDGGSVVLFQLE